jgi:serine/threonine protein kinase
LTVSIDLGIPGLEEAQEIGRGGFGVVYRARQSVVGRSVAVKMLSIGSLSEDTRRRFEHECKAMAAVSSHPNIVALYDSGVSSAGRPYIVMELVSGGTLASQIPIDWVEATQVGVKIAGALETAHRIGIFHRDVKPENILLSAYGEPKLTDFGVAKVAESSETPSGNITASILHAAPETLSGGRPSAATDVYSLASTLFALLTGRAPFATAHQEESLTPLLARIAIAPVPDLRGAGVPDTICTVLEQALAKDPTARPATPGALGELLREAQHANGLTPTEMPIEGVKRPPSEPVKATQDDRPTKRRDREELRLPRLSSSPKSEDTLPPEADRAGGVAAGGWQGLGRRARWVLTAGLAVVALAVAAVVALLLLDRLSGDSKTTAIAPSGDVLADQHAWSLSAAGSCRKSFDSSGNYVVTTMDTEALCDASYGGAVPLYYRDVHLAVDARWTGLPRASGQPGQDDAGSIGLVCRQSPRSQLGTAYVANISPVGHYAIKKKIHGRITQLAEGDAPLALAGPDAVQHLELRCTGPAGGATTIRFKVNSVELPVGTDPTGLAEGTSGLALWKFSGATVTATFAHLVIREPGAVVNGLSVGTPQGIKYSWGPCTAQDFTGSAYGPVLVSGTKQPRVVRGAIRTGWLNAGGGPGRLGCPTSDEYVYGPGNRQDFDHGSLVWYPGTKQLIVL